MSARQASLAAPLVLLTACVATGGPDGGPAPILEDYDGYGGGRADGFGDVLSATLTERYGVRPRRYTGLLHGDTEAEHRFLTSLPEVAAFLNGVAQRRGVAIEVDEAELATNFITEGGYFVLKDNRPDCIDGFGDLGIDTLVDNLEALRPWLHQSVVDAIAAGDRATTHVNERGETVHTLSSLSLEEGLYANAGMFAWAMAVADSDLRARGSSMSSLPVEGQFFWATMYYNAGPGTARRRLDRHGARYYEQRWTRADDPGVHGSDAQYNALWRTASYAYFLGSLCPSGDCPAAPPEVPPPAPPSWCETGGATFDDSECSRNSGFCVRAEEGCFAAETRASYACSDADRICCVPVETECSQNGGLCINGGEHCQDNEDPASFACASPDGICCVRRPSECEQNGGLCVSSESGCLASETQESYDCDFAGAICCVSTASECSRNGGFCVSAEEGCYATETQESYGCDGAAEVCCVAIPNECSRAGGFCVGDASDCFETETVQPLDCTGAGPVCCVPG